ncbi:MAG: flagellar basal body P-ring formation chaperone FlgA [Rhodospirillaceae bacterium]
MKPIVALGLGTALSLAAFAADAAQLRLQTTTTEDTIKLGDFFDGLARTDAERLIVPAPPLGRSVSFDADFLRRLAQTYHVDWQPASRETRILVSRAARTIGIEELRKPVMAALARRSAGGRLEVEFDNPLLQVVVPSGPMPEITVEEVYYNANQNHFSAEAVIGAGGPAPQRVSLAGRARLIVEMPVLNRRINPGEVITRADIGWVEFNANQLSGNLAASEADLVNHTPRRSLAVNIPVYLYEVQAPKVVSRGQMVTMVLRSRNMLLTTQGKATQDGAAGEVIRVINTQSNRSVDATVVSANEVTVFVPSISTN